MRLSTATIGLLVLPTAYSWGSLGHITIAYLASEFVGEDTAAYFKDLLRNDTAHYLAGVATWADTIRYIKWGRFTKNYHFIDAKDAPPTNCHVDFERDCKESCLVALIRHTPECITDALGEGWLRRFRLENYTSQMLGSDLVAWRRNQAAKFIIHFMGDIHQPLHAENVAQGGNGIHVKWASTELSLHHVWDTSIAEKLLGGIHRQPYPAALAWARNLSAELAFNYFERAAPVIELQIARAGYRLARWLDLIFESISAQVSAENEL
ncbi:hypothetical protein PG994_007377 [Apiospora phragmitis]|uniref:Uncharacterized protein n=1 Tax=Apiospora phragmitis TaxID=2905665 RepID=A0ABR1V0M6_9PEZI